MAEEKEQKVEKTKEEVKTEPKEEVKETKEVKTVTKKETNKGKSKNRRKAPVQKFDKEGWKPKTSIGKLVKEGTINDIQELLNKGYKILEPEIVDVLLPNMETDLLLIGQSKGKFGGGQRRVFRQTQKKTREGNKPKFATYALVGNNDGMVGIGYGKAKETVPAREKAIRNAKLNIMMIRRGCGSWQCNCKDPHSVPFTVEGKCGSVIVKIMPAPKGTGLCIEGECAKILKASGIKDVWSKTLGRTTTKINTVKACEEALKELMRTKTLPTHNEILNITEGKSKKATEEEKKDE